MKLLHTSKLYGWSRFNEERNIDFHSVLSVREQGNVIIDPLPLSPHDAKHLLSLGPVAWIVITNSDHVRAAAAVAQLTGAPVAGPERERAAFPFPCSRWLGDGDPLLPDVELFELEGSKTPGELALLLDGKTLVTGDLIRAHAAGSLCLLPPAKLRDPVKAVASVRRLAAIETIEAVLTGDGWPIFYEGHRMLVRLLQALESVGV